LWRELLVYTASGFGLTVLVVGIGWGLSRTISTALVTTGLRSQEVAQTIVAAVQQLSSATNETATMVAQTTTTVDELRKTSEASAQRAQEVADGAGRSKVASNETLTAVRRGTEAMQNIRQDVEGIAQTIVDLSSRTIQISEIVQSVGAIAEQSNLLAVNASIEAAKAGEYGRGFSVVASEVKALAQQSKEATDRIRQILAEIQKSSNAAVMITEQGVKRVEEGADLIQEMGRGVDELATVITHSADAANQILLTSREQVVGVGEIAQAMQSIEQATKENAAGAHQLESAATTVKAVAVQLGEIVHGRAG
jgi:methyl-accepting chemotaxis protein